MSEHHGHGAGQGHAGGHGGGGPAGPHGAPSAHQAHGAGPQGHGAQFGPSHARPNPGVQNPFGSIGEFLRDDFTRGVLVGAATTYFLTNPKVQKAAMATAVRVWDAVQGGVAELRERFQDAEAEIHSNGGEKPEET